MQFLFFPFGMFVSLLLIYQAKVPAKEEENTQ